MANDPQFAATPLYGVALTPATLDTSLTAPTHTAQILASQTNGCKIEQIRFVQVATTAAAGIVNLFLYDGTNYRLFDFYTFAAVSLSTTSELAPVDKYYPNLIIPTGWQLVCSVTVAAGQSAFNVHAFGGAY
jgi:hypothetical protein